jgi:hypothetical protein
MDEHPMDGAPPTTAAAAPVATTREELFKLLRTLKQQLDAEKLAHGKLQAEKAEQEAALRSESESLKRQVEERDAEIARRVALSLKLEALTFERDALAKQLEQGRSESSVQIEQLQADMVLLQARNEAAESQLKQDNDATRAEEDALVAALHQEEKIVWETKLREATEKHEREKASLEQQLAAAQNAKKQVEEQLFQIRQQRSEAESNLNASSREELDQVTRQRDTASGRAADEAALRKKAEGRLTEAKERISKLEGELLQFRLDAEQAHARLASLVSGQPGEWQAVQDRGDPVPQHLSFDSPVIQQVLLSWTDQRTSVDFFNKWCSYVLSGQDVSSGGFQKGVEINKVSSAVRDGILALIVPMLRARQDVSVSVFERERCEAVWHDVRLRVSPKPPPLPE